MIMQPVVYRIIPISKNKDGSENTTFFITEEAKEVFYGFSTKNYESIMNMSRTCPGILFCFNII